MVKVLIGDLFESSTQTWVNTVNCVGIMGKGIALEFKKRFPDMFKDYVLRCKNGSVMPGKPYLYRNLLPPWILNFPTKDHWRSTAKLDDIIKGLEYLVKHYQEWGITSLAIPPLGCGEGQLEWRIVGPSMYRYLSKMNIPVELYAPYGTPHQELNPDFLTQKFEETNIDVKMPDPRWVEPGWVALVEILNRIEAQPYHWPVGRTMFQKIAYVATEQGIPTKLKYQRGSYGPFAPELKNLITRLANHGLIVEQRLGRMFEVKIGQTYPDAQKAYQDDLQKWEKKIDRIVDLFMRLDTNQSEIVATVIFSANDLFEQKRERCSELDVYEHVMQWKQRRRPPLNEQEVASTIRNLAALGWLTVNSSAELPLPESELMCV